ncbi:SH3 domain-containing protein [Leptospira kanakyensis]|nr:SH3 domain-containing protein [Leptospira kanakyensis]
MNKKIKYIIILIILTLFTLSCKNGTDQSDSQKTSEESPNPTYNNAKIEIFKDSELYFVSNPEGVYLRKYPTKLSEPITYLYEGKLIEVTGKTLENDIVNGKKGYWYKINWYDKTKGWIFSEYIQKGKLNYHLKDETIKKIDLESTDTALPKNNKVILYNSPHLSTIKLEHNGEDFIKIIDIEAKTLIKNLELVNWIKVEYKNEIGYVISNSIKLLNGNCQQFIKTYDANDKSWVQQLKIGETLYLNDIKLFDDYYSFDRFENYGAALINSRDKINLIFFKFSDKCSINTGNSLLGLIKILDIKELAIDSSKESAKFQNPDGLVCENKKAWIQEAFVITGPKKVNGDFLITKSYRFNIYSEKIENISTNSLSCYEHCDRVDCD